MRSIIWHTKQINFLKPLMRQREIQKPLQLSKSRRKLCSFEMNLSMPDLWKLDNINTQPLSKKCFIYNKKEYLAGVLWPTRFTKKNENPTCWTEGWQVELLVCIEKICSEKICSEKIFSEKICSEEDRGWVDKTVNQQRKKDQMISYHALTGAYQRFDNIDITDMKADAWLKAAVISARLLGR